MINNKKIAFFGCKHTTKDCMKKFLDEIGKIDILITINPELGHKNKVAGYMDLTEFGEKNNIEIYFAKKYSLKTEEDYNWIKNKNIDLAFVIGWQRLIPSNILKEISIGTFGVHGSADNLPRGRGRSPMNWALILDRKEFFTNLFKYEDNIDGGGILDTQRFDINEHDSIKTLHNKNTLSMYKLIKTNIDSLTKNDFILKKQDDTKSTYFPKRNPEDGFIDWNLKTKDIYNFCRALTKPFPGAYSFVDKKIIRIWNLGSFTESQKYKNSYPSEIIEVFSNEKFAVKTKDGAVIINEYEIDGKGIIKKGKRLESKDYKKIYKDIEKRYPDFVKPEQKEITLKKMIEFYERL